MENIKIIIDCPNCDNQDCVCLSNYKDGTDSVFCVKCDYYKKYFRSRDNNGNFDWTNKLNYLSDENIIERNVPTKSFAVYIIEKPQPNGDTLVGQLYNEEDLNNFKAFFNFIEAHDPVVKKVIIRRFFDGRAADIILYPKNVIG